MTPLLFTLLVFVSALVAGFCGSLLGLDGGNIIIPVLTLLFHVLIATPVLRVGVSIFAFVLQKDWVFTIIHNRGVCAAGAVFLPGAHRRVNTDLPRAAVSRSLFRRNPAPRRTPAR